MMTTASNKQATIIPINTNTPIESQVLQEFKSAHIEESQQLAQSLVKITNLSAATVKSHLDAMLEQLVSKVKRRFDIPENEANDNCSIVASIHTA